MNATAPVVRLPDLRQTAKGPGGDASAIIVHRLVCVRRSKRIGIAWRSRRNGRVLRPGGNDGRILEQAGRIVLRRERRTCRERGGEREDRTSYGLRASSAPEEVVDRNRAVFCRWQGAPVPHGRASRSRCGPFDFRVVTLAALGRKSRVSISLERGKINEHHCPSDFDWQPCLRKATAPAQLLLQTKRTGRSALLVLGGRCKELCSLYKLSTNPASV